MSLLLKPAVQNGASFSLVIYKAAGGFQAEVYLVVIVSIICLKPSDIYQKNGLIRRVQAFFGIVVWP